MKELSEFKEKKAIVQKVLVGIKARDQCIKQIEEISQKDFSGN